MTDGRESFGVQPGTAQLVEIEIAGGIVEVGGHDRLRGLLLQVLLIAVQEEDTTPGSAGERPRQTVGARRRHPLFVVPGERRAASARHRRRHDQGRIRSGKRSGEIGKRRDRRPVHGREREHAARGSAIPPRRRVDRIGVGAARGRFGQTAHRSLGVGAVGARQHGAPRRQRDHARERERHQGTRRAQTVRTGQIILHVEDPVLETLVEIGGRHDLGQCSRELQATPHHAIVSRARPAGLRVRHAPRPLRRAQPLVEIVRIESQVLLAGHEALP